MVIEKMLVFYRRGKSLASINETPEEIPETFKPGLD